MDKSLILSLHSNMKGKGLFKFSDEVFLLLQGKGNLEQLKF